VANLTTRFRIDCDILEQLRDEVIDSIQRIAQLVGFDHAEYFNVVFEREVGLPPGRFREASRQPSPPNGR
jgi:AraC-like DNA-binding protein